ncbi:YfhO family protein [Phreatobacter aquaticus]|uniref:YfhO family protein n=1 Tax=Phreatobacter aquaticus TaxID=2570229 RepID=A0A4D7QWK7_9HYPH|nr:YfhO family protein [Phreatobacter aquaticus]QCK88292.1 YfhO family protein [Phreatobacter aquaticus]
MSAYSEARAGGHGARRVKDLAVQAGTSVARFAASRQGELVIALVAITALWALAAIQWRLTDTVVPWDSKNQFYAFFRFLATALHEGSTPFWNPYHYGGHPSIADPQSLIFQPPFVLWAWLDASPTMLAFDALVYGHLLVGGLALAGYGHRHGWPAAASVLAAAVFMFGGVVSGRLNHVGIITAYGLFPLAVLLLEVAFDRRSWLAAIGFGATAALIALGRTQTPLILSIILVVLAARHLLVRPEPLRYALTRLPVLLLMGATALALIAVPMLLTVQFADYSNRPHISLDTALLSSLYPVNIANFFAPNVLGSLQPSSLGDWGPSHGTRPGIDGTDRAFNYMFAGSLTALLLVWHGLAGGRLLASGRRVFAVVAVLALLYSVGRYSPFFPLMFQYFPGIALFRRPVGGLFIFIPALAYLSGYLVSDYVKQGLPAVPRWALAILGGAMIGLFAWAIDFSTLSSKGWQAALETAKVLPIYGALIVLFMLARSPRARVIAASVAVAFTGGELVLRNAASSLNAEPRAYYSFLEKPMGEEARILGIVQRAIQASHTGSVRPRVEIVGLGGPWQNAAMVYGLEATNGYNPLRIGQYDRLVAPGESPYTALHRRFPNGSFPGYDCDLSKLLGLEYVVLDRPIEAMPHLHRRTVVETVMAGPKVWIYRLPNPAPRVALASRVRVADADELVDQGRFPARTASTTATGTEVMVDDDDDLSQSYVQAAANAQPGKAEIVSWRPDRVEIAVETRTTAVLTDHALWYPGWEVEVDGVRRPLLRTDVLFRGVEIPPGAKKVVFTYRPLSLENLKAAFDGMLGRDND